MCYYERMEGTDDAKQPPINKQHRWKKGESGNPAGRKKNIDTLTALVREELKKVPVLKGKDGKLAVNTKTWSQLLAEALPAAVLRALMNGDVKPYALLLERLEGKPQQPIDITSGGQKLGYDIKVTDDIISQGAAIIQAARSPN